MNLLDDNSIQKMSYPDFIGAMELENTSLLGEFAVDYWISKANINEQSKVLEIACSTGYNLRKCAVKSKSSGVGIDISKSSIQNALKKTKQENLNHQIQFQIGNAEKMSFSKNSFTHVISGMSFSFIQDREQALRDAARVLRPQGYLLTAIVYYKEKPSVKIINEVEEVFGFRPCDSWNYDWWKNFFSKFFILKNEISIINAKTEIKNQSSLRDEIFDYVFNSSHKFENCRKEIKNLCAERLFKIHQTIRNHGRHQVGKLQVWRLKN